MDELAAPADVALADDVHDGHVPLSATLRRRGRG
jgi:hypothetical protein